MWFPVFAVVLVFLFAVVCAHERGALLRALCTRFLAPPPASLVVFPGEEGTVERAVVLGAVAASPARVTLARVTLAHAGSRPTVWTADDGTVSGCLTVCRVLAARTDVTTPATEASLELLSEFLCTLRHAGAERALADVVERDALSSRTAGTLADVCWTAALVHVAQTHTDAFAGHASLVAWLRARTDADSSDEEEEDKEDKKTE